MIFDPKSNELDKRCNMDLIKYELEESNIIYSCSNKEDLNSYITLISDPEKLYYLICFLDYNELLSSDTDHLYDAIEKLFLLIKAYELNDKKSLKYLLNDNYKIAKKLKDELKFIYKHIINYYPNENKKLGKLYNKIVLIVNTLKINGKLLKN